MASAGSRWSIGIYRGSTPLALAPDPRARNPVLTASDVDDVDAAFVADPFMLRHGGCWFMFFEVLNRPLLRGHIGAASSDDGLTWRYDGVVLREEFHLSYPFVFAHEGEHYMLPETFESSSVRLYRATRFPDEWTLDHVLLEEIVVDSSLLHHGGRLWLFGCTAPKNQDVLRLWSADSLHGPWVEHPRSPIIANDPASARPAGRPVIVDGHIYRFAQDCGREYGAAVRTFEITRLTIVDYEERAVAASPLAASVDAWNARRMHHIDAHRSENSWIACVDGDSLPRG
jgi:hypothetical protein